jgi:hypothetical protein
MRSPRVALVALVLALSPLASLAVTSPVAVTSPMGGNGHNVTFDGRLFIVRTTPGWEARLLRPEAASSQGGVPSLTVAFAPPVLVQNDVNNENALALCEATPQPTRCNADGSANGSGSHACYDLYVIDSDAIVSKPANVLRRRRLKVVVSSPGTTQASIDNFTWTEPALTPLSPALRGIEPTVTKDGKLMVWQGVPSNTGDIDTLVYSTNTTACGVSGWSTPKSIAAMATDPAVVGRYRLAERPLRDAAGTAFTSSQLFYGAYPWLFPDGEAINFTAVNMPCRSGPPNEDPPGCGPRRNAISVIGYPTNWQLAHVDGAVNPSRVDVVRLFFSSPGPAIAGPLPVTVGRDVWPFFGSNTQNYTELVFDDGLDGRYAGLWHLNEFVTAQGNFDLGRVADSSGYSNTGTLRGGASLPPANNGKVGKAITLDGVSGRVEVPHATSLHPVNAITVEAWVKPAASPDCDASNNYRLLLGKPNINGSYSLVLEDDLSLQARVRVAGGTQYDLRSNVTLPVGQWSHVAFQYDAATGTMNFLVNGTETNRSVRAPALLEGVNQVLFIGGPGARAACPANGDGAFQGELDEVAISRAWRYGTSPSGGGTGGGGGSMMGGGGGSSTGGGGGSMTGGGGGSSTGGGGGAATGGGGGSVTGGGGGSASGGGGGSATGGGGGSATGGGGGSTTGGGGGAATGGGGGAATGGGGGAATGGGGGAATGGGSAGGEGGSTGTGGGGTVEGVVGCSASGAHTALVYLLALGVFARSHRRRRERG